MVEMEIKQAQVPESGQRGEAALRRPVRKGLSEEDTSELTFRKTRLGSESEERSRSRATAPRKQ